MTPRIVLFGAMRDGSWYWGLGDPDLGAVLVTFTYLLASILCGLAARRFGAKVDSMTTKTSAVFQKRFWVALALLMFLLGVNKQGDFQSLITVLGRDAFKSLGMYDSRRSFQILFIAVIAIMAFVGATFMVWCVRKWTWEYWLAATGLGFQAAFVVIRAVSFHHVDSLLGLKLHVLKFNLILESIGLFLLIIAASACLLRPAKQ